MMQRVVNARKKKKDRKEGKKERKRGKRRKEQRSDNTCASNISKPPNGLFEHLIRRRGRKNGRRDKEREERNDIEIDEVFGVLITPTCNVSQNPTQF